MGEEEEEEVEEEEEEKQTLIKGKTLTYTAVPNVMRESVPPFIRPNCRHLVLVSL